MSTQYTFTFDHDQDTQEGALSSDQDIYGGYPKSGTIPEAMSLLAQNEGLRRIRLSGGGQVFRQNLEITWRLV